MEIGFFGKLPSHGDFLRRRVSDAFVDRWDRWLQESLAASRAALGERWLEVYLTSPAWRFACAAGPCGSSPVAGLIVPSVDSVGRYFPLTLIAELPVDVSLVAVATAGAPFFDNAERLLLDTLEAETVDFEAFDARVNSFVSELASICTPPPLMLDASAAAVLVGDGQAGWQIPLGSTPHLRSVFEQLVSQHLTSLYQPLMLWWTQGSAIVEPSCLIGRGLPRPEMFASLLDGSWSDSDWRSISARIEDLPPTDGFEEQAIITFRSAAASDVGRVRKVNQDAFIARPEIGLWAVADGLGGHRDGEIASRMVCDALADFEPNAGFEDMIEAACQRMFQVNDVLLRHSARSSLADRSGSTVAMLLVRGESCAVLWAGDSRVYRLRAGRLDRLTRDHSLAESIAAPNPSSHAVTRAVGVEATLSIDVHRDKVLAGDRFLLCSDGLTHTLSDGEILGWLNKPDVRGAVDGLIEATLGAGAPDNVTVLIAEAY